MSNFQLFCLYVDASGIALKGDATQKEIEETALWAVQTPEGTWIGPVIGKVAALWALNDEIKRRLEQKAI